MASARTRWVALAVCAGALLVTARGGSSGSAAKVGATTTTPRGTKTPGSGPAGPTAGGKLVYMATSSAVGTDKVDLLALDTGSLAVRAHVALPFTGASGVAVAAGSDRHFAAAQALEAESGFRALETRTRFGGLEPSNRATGPTTGSAGWVVWPNSDKVL